MASPLKNIRPRNNQSAPELDCNRRPLGAIATPAPPSIMSEGMRKRTATDRTRQYLALEAAGWTFAVPVDDVVRVLRFSDLGGRGRTRSRATSAKDSVTVLRASDWFGAPPGPTQQSVLVQLRHELSDYCLEVEHALQVFQMRPEEMREADLGIWHGGTEAVLGYCPWSKLAPYLVRGALTANNVARARLARLGPLRVDEGRLYAGQTRLSGTHELVDSVMSTTQFGCTLFLGDVRISTTATRAGSAVRAFGTRAGAEVTRTVLEQGREFRGVTQTIGKEWAVVYRPLLDHNHRIIGMCGTFREVSAQLFPVLHAASVVQALSSGGQYSLKALSSEKAS